MDNLSDIFNKAAAHIQTFEDISDNDKLILYGLFKQAKLGDNKSQRPSLLKIKDVTKHDSWMQNIGMEANDAKRLYIKKVTELSKSNKQKRLVV